MERVFRDDSFPEPSLEFGENLLRGVFTPSQQIHCGSAHIRRAYFHRS
jgi:hypothetical protein